MENNFEKRERLFKMWRCNRKSWIWNRRRSSNYLSISGKLSSITKEEEEEIKRRLSDLGYIGNRELKTENPKNYQTETQILISNLCKLAERL